MSRSKPIAHAIVTIAVILASFSVVIALTEDEIAAAIKSGQTAEEGPPKVSGGGVNTLNFIRSSTTETITPMGTT